MAVPKFFEFFEAFLRAIQDGELHTSKEVRTKVADDLKLSADDLEETNDESPMEILDAAFKHVNATLASELMDEVMKLTPTEFEKLVTGFQGIIVDLSIALMSSLGDVSAD